MEAMNSENSDDTVQQPDDTTQQSDNTIGELESTVSQFDSAVEQADNAVEQVDNAVEQADNAVEQADNAVEQADNAVEQVDNVVEQADNAVEQANNAVEQTDNAVEQTDNAVEQTDNTVEQTDNAAEQTDNAAEQTDNTAEQTDNAAEQADNAVKQADNVVEQANNAVEHMDTTEQNPKTSDDATSHTENTDKPVPMEVECDQQSKSDCIDFTTDISLDQLDVQKELTDEDVMNHLDVIENIELDPETFGIDKPEKDINQSSKNMGGKTQHEEVIILNEMREGIKENWYKKKIADKEALVKERLSKLARVLGITYPHYEKWLERIEKKEGSPMCKLDPFRCCPLDKPHTNRWKFECIMKDMQATAVEKDNPSFNKAVWHLEPTSAWGVDINNTSEFPSFVLKAVKLRLCWLVELSVQ